MSSQTQTFPCPFCGRRMGVGIDLLGKHVRCPHCKQVVLAPATVGGAPGAPGAPAAPQPAAPQPAAAPPPQPQMMPPPPPAKLPPMPEPVFNILPKEAADSILSEPDESDDEVFGSQGFNRLPIPRLPEVAPAKAPAPYGAGPGPGPSPYGAPPYGAPPAAPQPYAPPAFNPQPAPAPYTPPAAPQPYAPPPAAANPFAPQPAANPFSFEGNGQPAAPQPAPMPVPAPMPMPAPAAGPQGLQATALDVNPFGGFDAPAAPAPGPAAQRPTVAAAPMPAPAPAPAPSNPWAGVEAAPQPVPQLQPMPAPSAFPQSFPAPAPAYPQPAPAVVQAPQPAPQQVEEVSEAPAKRDPRPQRGKAPAAGAAAGGIPKPVVYGIIGYAVLMTLLAIYGMFLRSPELPRDHPLSIIPDNFGEFDPAQRKKGAGVSGFKVDAPLPATQVASLGNKIELGGLEIEPIRIQKRAPEMWQTDMKGGNATRIGTGANALVLRVKVKNNSDLAFCPFDPAFSRKSSTGDQPFSRVVVPGSSDTFAGGPISWPFTKVRQYEKDQEKDSEPLKPGETREYTVCSTTSSGLLPAVRKASDRILWRIQVRRAPIEFREKNIPVTAIFGVEFSKGDVDGL